MSASRDYKVGYGRPPKRTRWKKGQCGNPKRRYPKRPRSDLEFIDGHLLRVIDVVENGKRKKTTVLAAIMTQLWLKEIDGDSRAFNLRLKYEELAWQMVEQGIEVELIEGDYSQALSAQGPGTRKKDE
jgi:hypothetical protein